MHISKINSFFEWASSGTAAAALAMFVYSVSAGSICVAAASLFLVSMIMSIASTAISKEIEIQISKEKEITKSADILHAISLTAGWLSFILGLGVLSFSVDSWLFFTLSIVFIAALSMYAAACKSLE